jgi:hypothetical protein
MSALPPSASWQSSCLTFSDRSARALQDCDCCGFHRGAGHRVTLQAGALRFQPQRRSKSQGVGKGATIAPMSIAPGLLTFHAEGYVDRVRRCLDHMSRGLASTEPVAGSIHSAL